MGHPTKTRDRDIREAVLGQVLSEHTADPKTRVIQELGIEHGSCRVDIAVVNGFIHGYELKSDSDSLVRLPRQISAYSRCLDRATVVVGMAHITSMEALVPDWWGIKAVSVGARGALRVETHRPVSNNPDLSLFHMAHLLWRQEAIDILLTKDESARNLKASRVALYKRLVECIPATELRRLIREKLKLREKWRHPALLS